MAGTLAVALRSLLSISALGLGEARAVHTNRSHTEAGNMWLFNGSKWPKVILLWTRNIPTLHGSCRSEHNRPGSRLSQ